MPFWLVQSDLKHMPFMAGPYFTEGEALQKKEKLEGNGWSVSGPYETSTDKRDKASEEVKEKRSNEVPASEGSKNFRRV